MAVDDGKGVRNNQGVRTLVDAATADNETQIIIPNSIKGVNVLNLGERKNPF